MLQMICLYHINVHVQHKQAIQGQTEACEWDVMPYYQDIYYHIDMTTHGKAYGEPVGGTGQGKLVAHGQRVYCESEQNRAGESSDH